MLGCRKRNIHAYYARRGPKQHKQVGGKQFLPGNAYVRGGPKLLVGKPFTIEPVKVEKGSVAN